MVYTPPDPDVCSCHRRLLLPSSSSSPFPRAAANRHTGRRMLRVSGKRISSFLWRGNQAALAVLSRDLINGDVASGAYGAIYHPLRLTSRLAFRDVIRDTNSRHPFAMGMGAVRSFSEDATHMPVITDPDIQNAFKDLMAANWDELPNAVIHDAKNALSKHTEDKAGQEALENVLRAAEAVEEFGGVLVSLRMAIDDSIGMSGEDVGPLPEEFVKALQVAFQRYTTYLDAFGPHEAYLRKKVETELGTKMIHLKMRCSGIGSEWGKVTVLGTSGLAGSYVEQRA